MIGTVLEQQDQGQVRVTAPAPGQTLCTAVFPAGSSCTAPPPGQGLLELLLCRSGRLQLAFGDGRTAALGPGDLLVRTAWAGEAKASAPLGDAVFVEMAMEEETLSQLYRGLSLPPVTLEQVRRRTEGGWTVLRDKDWSGPVLEALEQLPRDEQGGYVLLRALERLYLLCRQPENRRPPGGVYFDRYQRDAAERVRTYMVEHLDSRVTVEELAKRFQISATTLKACFRHFYGEPLHTYLQRYRLETAAELLRTTDLSVLEVAAAVGYSGTSRFGTAFKELYRQTPGAYRRDLREENVQNR